MPSYSAHSVVVALVLLATLVPGGWAQNNSTDAGTTVTITFDPVTAKAAATYIVAACALVYASFILIVVTSWFRFRVQVLPAINLMKNVEVEHVRHVYFLIF